MNNTPRLLVAGILSAAFLSSGVTFAQTRIQATPLEELVIIVERSVPAEVISLREAVISSQLTSTVVDIPFLVGDVVSQNLVIAELECIDNELSLEQARAELAALSANRVLAKQQLDRLNKLRQSNNASEEEINQKQAELNVVTARIKAQNIAINIAERQVDKCAIRAPFSGVITEIHSEQGNFVTPGSAILSIVDTKNIELSARVSNSELEQILESENLGFEYNQTIYPLAVRTTLNVLDNTSQTREMRLRFPESVPLAGAIGRLQWTLSGNILPPSLVVNRNGEAGIFIVDQSDSSNLTAHFHAVPDTRPGQPVSVDMDPDTLIVVEGRLNLLDGEAVQID